MNRRWMRIAGACLIVFVGAQLIRPERANPPSDASHAIQAEAGSSNRLVAVLDRACRDCHSNRTVWPWYTQIAPASWLMARGVAEGRKAVNFSEWASYQPDVQRRLLLASCQDVSTGKMPGVWTLLHPETRLSAQDIETICAAAQRTPVDTGVGR
jgi:hypothetical protein